MACSWMQQESSQLLRDSRGPVLTGHFLDLLNPPAAAWGALSKGQEAPQIPNDSSGIWLRITWLDLSLFSCSRNLEGCCRTALPKKPKKLPAFLIKGISWCQGCCCLQQQETVPGSSKADFVLCAAFVLSAITQGVWDIELYYI